MEGVELARTTGVSLDRLWLGSYCRIPLPEFGTEITERIVTLNYTDKVNQPETVKITLGNNRTDLTRIIADSTKSSSKSSRTSTKQSKEDHAWFEDTDNHVALCAKGIIGTDAQGNPNWVRLSRLEVNEDGIYGEVKSVQGDLVIAQTSIKMNEDAITLEAKRAKTAEGELSGKITVEADRITAEVTRAKTEEGKLSGKISVQADQITAEVTRAKNAELQLQGRIQVNADSVSMVVNQGSDTREIKYYEKYSDFPLPGSNLYRYYDMQYHRYYEWRSGGYVRIGDSSSIKASDICTAINEDGTTATYINSSKIYLLGQTIANTITADYIKTKVSSIAVLGTQAISNTGSIHSSSVEANNIYLIGADSQGHQVNTSLKDSIKSLQITQSGNTYTLQKKNYSDADWVDVGTFSRATTLTGAWSSGRFTVSASPQGESKYTDLTTQGHWGYASGEDPKHYYGGVSATIDGGQTSYSTGCWFNIDASSIYSNGWAGCYDDIGLNYSSAQTISPGGSITIYPAAKPTPSGQHASITSKGVAVSCAALSWTFPNSPSVGSTEPTGTFAKFKGCNI